MQLEIAVTWPVFFFDFFNLAFYEQCLGDPLNLSLPVDLGQGFLSFFLALKEFLAVEKRLNDLQFYGNLWTCAAFYFSLFVKDNSTLHRPYLELNATPFEDVEPLDSNCFIRLTILDVQALELPLRAIKRGNV